MQTCRIKYLFFFLFLFFLKNLNAQENKIQRLANIHFKTLENANYFEDWYQQDLTKFKAKIDSANPKRKQVLEQILSALDYINEENVDSAMLICYDLLYTKNLTYDDSVIVYQSLGKIFFIIGDVNGFRYNYVKASNILKRKEYLTNWLHSPIANSFMVEEKPDSALVYITKQLDYNIINYSIVYKNIANMYLKLNEVDSAFKYLKLAELYIEKNDSGEWKDEYMDNGYGEVYFRKGNLDSAKYFYLKTVKDTSLRENWYPLVHANVSLAQVFMDQGQHDSCIYYMDRFFLCPCLDYSTQIWLHNLKADYYKELGYEDKYLEHHNIASLLKDSLIDQQSENNNKLSELNRTRKNLIEENLKIKVEKNKLTEEKVVLMEEKNKALSVVMILLAVLFVLGILFLVFRFRKKKKLFEIEEKLLKSTLSETKLKKEKLELEVKAKNLDLSQLGSNLALKIDLLNNQKEALNELVNTNGEEEIKEILTNQITEIENNSFIDEKLNSFEGQLDEINKKLFLSLKEDFPVLTKNDIQICALHLLGLSTKEISLVRNVTPKSIQVNRYRIKKKLNLSEEDDFILFIEKYALK